MEINREKIVDYLISTFIQHYVKDVTDLFTIIDIMLNVGIITFEERVSIKELLNEEIDEGLRVFHDKSERNI